MRRFLVHLNLTTLFLLFTFCSIGQVTKVFELPAKERPGFLHDYCFTFLSNRPDTYVLATMDSVKRLAGERSDQKLLWYTKLLELAYRSYRLKNGNEDRLFLTQRSYFENAPDAEIKGAYYFFLGSVYFNSRNFEKSFIYYIRANDIFEDIGYQNISLLSHYLYSFYYLYYQMGDYPSAVAQLQYLIKNAPPKNKIYFPFDLNNLGVTYLKMGQVEKAQSIFGSSINWAKKTGNTVYIGIASGNYGNTLRLQGRYKEALPFLYTDVTLNKVAVASNSAISCVYLANCLLHLDSITKAARYLDTALILNPDRVWSSFSGHFFKTKALFYKKTGNFQLASQYQDSLLALNDSITRSKDVALLKAIALQFQEEKRQNERREKELENSRALLKRNSIVVLVIVVFLMAFTFLHSRRKKERRNFEQQLARDQEKFEQFEQKIEQSEMQLLQYLEVLKEKNQAIKQIEATIEKSVEGDLEIVAGNEFQKQKFSVQSLLTENDWQKFKSLFTLVYPEFFSGLMNRYVGLSQGEIRMLALCKLGFSPQEMANMLGISLQSVRTNRYRLRKRHPQLVLDDDFKKCL